MSRTKFARIRKRQVVDESELESESDGCGDYLVDRILDHKMTINNRNRAEFQYYVHWKGYRDNEDCWITEECITSGRKLMLQEYDRYLARIGRSPRLEPGVVPEVSEDEEESELAGTDDKTDGCMSDASIDSNEPLSTRLLRKPVKSISVRQTCRSRAISDSSMVSLPERRQLRDKSALVLQISDQASDAGVSVARDLPLTKIPRLSTTGRGSSIKSSATRIPKKSSSDVSSIGKWPTTQVLGKLRPANAQQPVRIIAPNSTAIPPALVPYKYGASSPTPAPDDPPNQESRFVWSKYSPKVAADAMRIGVAPHKRASFLSGIVNFFDYNMMIKVAESATCLRNLCAYLQPDKDGTPPDASVVQKTISVIECLPAQCVNDESGNLQAALKDLDDNNDTRAARILRHWVCFKQCRVKLEHTRKTVENVMIAQQRNLSSIADPRLTHMRYQNQSSLKHVQHNNTFVQLDKE